MPNSGKTTAPIAADTATKPAVRTSQVQKGNARYVAANRWSSRWRLALCRDLSPTIGSVRRLTHAIEPQGAVHLDGRQTTDVNAARKQVLRTALARAQTLSSTSGGWPEHLPAAQQDAWMFMVEVEAILVGSVSTQLTGGPLDVEQVRAALALLDGAELKRQWDAGEVAGWRAVAQTLLEP